ncbi:SDR family NAD(P)-dependent oxidoreductase [Pedobacter psychroterrae]|uniref:SDR family oxidoreductase n=1 Tax=Pedobacter psychroterrae TaxID=2530453 RepID=A0A4R0NKL5_9SPHI|nr:SDR family oxidoreductase [Pedobacter psychroterrae]TCD01126.1 SDR family oxidoreductase [Pedobacter psychroterrae]
MKYALVTGASKGIGKSLAIQLAAAGYHLLLVSRSDKDLKELSALITDRYPVTALYLPCDLSENGACAKVADWCNGLGAELSVLVNNAGYGLFGNFDQIPLNGQSEMIRLNINAVVELTHLLLPMLKKQTQSYILNVASTAAYQAMPTLAIYAATKSFVLSYSRALRYELKDSVVSVTCLSPGPTETAFASRAGLDMLADLAEKFNMQPDAVARIGLKGMFAKKTEIIAGFVNKISAFGAGLLPKSLVERISANLYK